MSWRINLLPWRQMRETAIRQRLLRQFGLAFAMALVVTVVWHVVESVRWQTQQQRLTLLRQTQDTYAGKRHELDRLQARHAVLSERIEHFRQLKSNRQLAGKILDQLALKRPAGMRYTQLDYAGQELIMQGKADRHEAIGRLIRRLEADEILRDPVLSAVKESSDEEGNTFRLALKVDKKPGSDKDDRHETTEWNSPSG